MYFDREKGRLGALATTILTAASVLALAGAANAASDLTSPKKNLGTGKPAAIKASGNKFWIFGRNRNDRLVIRHRNRRTETKKQTRRRTRRVVSSTPATPAKPPQWQVDGPTSGPIHIVVSLPDQKASIFRNGVRVVETKVSTGKPGHRTPAGIFSILEKNRVHFSNLYDNAPMPFMQRITWGGVALHAGVVPNYPASHGCIRMPKQFARELFSYTRRGAHVIVSNSDATPVPFSHPLLFQPVGPATTKIEVKGKGEAERAIFVRAALHEADLERKAEMPAAERELAQYPLRILITRRTKLQYRRDIQAMLNELGYEAGTPDGRYGRKTISAVKKFQEDIGVRKTGVIDESLVDRLYKVAGKGRAASGHLFVRRKFKDIYDAPVVIRDPERPLGNHFLTTLEIDNDDTKARWLAMTLRSRVQITSADDNAVPAISIDPTLEVRRTLDRIEISPEVRKKIDSMLTSGSSIVITDHGKGRMTGLGTDFIVLANKRYKPQ